MSEPTLDQRTPNIRLKYEADDARNYNWARIDDVWGAFLPTVPVPPPPAVIASYQADFGSSTLFTPTFIITMETPAIVTGHPVSFAVSAAAYLENTSGTPQAVTIEAILLRDGTSQVNDGTMLRDHTWKAKLNAGAGVPFTFGFLALGTPGDVTTNFRRLKLVLLVTGTGWVGEQSGGTLQVIQFT